MSDALLVPFRFGRSATVKAIEHSICELELRVSLCTELIREEPEFRYFHELERDALLQQINEQRFRLSKLKWPTLSISA
ncbi:hypothetical protein KJY73_20670 [Bowmanella sp. Y26]|uniref:Uncharacterized protein n=1 Tax=Bowmanella yangjiangensis TaxID=2811230 RepID=A0ABS3CRP0_9ALTE|nr:hypothetical protein [Bowmanella yangjiangensis]MBN7819315.1 hypothetical protein [Bowmanella yangjiangensis]MBT1066001.1 hypothetical protein [Bowmanella yangjiangensis]